MFKNVKNFLAKEDGYTAETLVWTTILGLGAAAVAFGIYIADRASSVKINTDIKGLQTPSTIPATGETFTPTAGATGAVVGL